jgi:HlyD family secretion protein
MDIQRPELAKKKKRKRIALTALGVILFAVVVIGLFRFDPGPYKVDESTVWIGEVERGQILREVRGVGSLIPAEIRWVAARSSGRIERIFILPGSIVQEDDIIMEMSNPELLQKALNAKLELKAAEADYVSYKVDLQSKLLLQKSVMAQITADFKEAQLQSEINSELYKDGLESKLAMKRSLLRVEQLETRVELERQRLEFSEQSLEAQLSARDSQMEQTRALNQLLQEQLDGLTVRAGVAGVLQRQEVEAGQQIGMGQSLSQVANPKSLKAVIRISEHQAKDILIGQNAVVDTRNGLVKGRVTRVDPNVEAGTVAVDVELIGELPKGSRPDLTVEGVIEIEKLDDVVYVGRPIYASSEKTARIYRLEGDSNLATRVPVLFGRSSVNTIEVVNGLVPGDRIILSDTSDWDSYDVLQLN